MLYFAILIFKIIEVSIGTMRIVLITRGERMLGAFLGFVEVALWISVVSAVLNDIQSDPFKALAYAAGFALGNYVGSMLEQKLGIGNVRVEAIVMEEDGAELASSLRAKGYAVTVMEGQGMNHERHILLMNIQRKRSMEIVKFIRKCQENVVITINDIKPVYGGYGILRK